MSKNKKQATNDFHFRYKNEKVKNFLDNQPRKSQSIELAILLAINSFGQDDLLASLESWLLDKKINVYSDKYPKRVNPQNQNAILNEIENSQKEKKTDKEKNSKKKKEAPKVTNTEPKKEKNERKTVHRKKIEPKHVKNKATSSERLTNEEINKMLWDGNSSNL